LHFADKLGRVRMSSVVSSRTTFVPVADQEASSRISRDRATDEILLARGNASDWESAALARIRQGKVETACMLLNAYLTESSRWEDRSSMRLIDLLAGISVRYDREAIYLLPLVSSLSAAMRGSIQDRITKWENPKSNWRTRWADRSRPVVWHHPFEVVGDTVEVAAPWRDSGLQRQRPVTIP
jgi:hypothetical protein